MNDTILSESVSKFNTHIARICDLNHSAALLEWDQETYMPSGAAASRASQISTLRQMSHELLTSDTTASLLEKLESDGLKPGSIEADHVLIVRKDFERATKIPGNLVAQLAETAALSRGAWMKARTQNEFELFAPHLEKIIDLCRQKAEALTYKTEIYDPLLDEFEPGTSTAKVRLIFEELREKLVPIVQQIATEPAPEDDFLHTFFPRDAQWKFGLDVAKDFGYDMNTGRQDYSAHPFSTTFSISDVRITTRIDEHFFNPGFFGTLHESGHGMYEQGVSHELERTLLADGTSLGMHESQSRMWENLIGRSREFWSHYYPRAQAAFPGALSGVSEQDFYRAVNKVAPSLIRVEADELTYNLHIMVRFELEIELLEDRIKVAELPSAWNDRMESYLGVRPKSDSDGVLQDIHWSLGAFGYFPTYALGNLISSQLYDQVSVAIPDLPDQIAEGSFSELLAWLRKHIHVFGRRKSAAQILRETTNSELSIESWIHYIEKKYETLYGH